MLATQHRVVGLLWSAIEHGAVDASADVIDLAGDRTTNALRTCLLSEQNAVHALAALARVGIAVRMLKGVAIAHLDHADPSERVYGDCDLLISRADYDRALAALTDAGFRRAEPPVRGWWERRFAKAIVLYAPAGGELDLHLTITGGYFGERIDHERLWSASSRPFLLAGVEAHGLDVEGRLLTRLLPRRVGRRLRAACAPRHRPTGTDQRRRLAGDDRASDHRRCRTGARRRRPNHVAPICDSIPTTPSPDGPPNSSPIPSSDERSTATTNLRQPLGVRKVVPPCQHSVRPTGSDSWPAWLCRHEPACVTATAGGRQHVRSGAATLRRRSSTSLP